MGIFGHLPEQSNSGTLAMSVSKTLAISIVLKSDEKPRPGSDETTTWNLR